jgi:hypothetical protein
VAFGCRVQRFEVFGCQSHSDDLHRLSTTSRTSAAAAHQLGHVIAGLGLVGLLLDLLFAHHEAV